MTDQEYEDREIQIIKCIEAIEAEYRKAIEPYDKMLIDLRATRSVPIFVTVEQSVSMGMVEPEKIRKVK